MNLGQLNNSSLISFSFSAVIWNTVCLHSRNSKIQGERVLLLILHSSLFSQFPYLEIARQSEIRDSSEEFPF